MNNIAIVPDGFGATYLNNNIASYADLVFFCKSALGYPIQNVELTDTQWALIVDEALMNWTQWEGNRKEEYLVFCSDLYERGCGVKLDELIQVGCNTQFCYQTVTTETVTSVETTYDKCGTFPAYVSVTPFVYPTPYNIIDPNSVAFSGTSGQVITLKFDPANPWSMDCVCDADCAYIKPVNSEWFKLSSNYCLSALTFDFESDSTLSPLYSAISAQIINYPVSAVPLSGMGSALSSVPVEYYSVGCFYAPDELQGPPLEACINIGKGRGYIYPFCDTSLINPCTALSSQFLVSPQWNYVLTALTLTSVTVDYNSVEFPEISSYFQRYCANCHCNCSYLTSLGITDMNEYLATEDDFFISTDSDLYIITSENPAASSYTFGVYRTVLSGSDGLLYDLSARDISSATHLKLYNVPSCTTDGSIPLDSNDGILGAFTLCNSALYTGGPMRLEKVQFFRDYKLPSELVDSYCGWENNGFTMHYYNSAHGNCVRATPKDIKVDVEFSKKNVATYTGTISSFLSGNVDSAINRKRKVLGVFAVDNANSGFGGTGGDLLFNFDYALMANVFGYDLMGTRNVTGKAGYDLLTYHMARSFVEHSRKMLRYISYQFDPKTQYLRLTPSPPIGYSSDCCRTGGMADYNGGTQCYMVGLYVEPPVEECLSEYWVREYVLARAMQTLGLIRSKFGGVTVFGGQTLEGTTLLQQGTTRIETLMKELRTENYYNPPSMFFIH